MRHGHIHRLGTSLQEQAGGYSQRAAGAGHVIEQDHLAPGDRQGRQLDFDRRVAMALLGTDAIVKTRTRRCSLDPLG